MTSLFQRGAAFLSEKRDESCSVEVAYKRPGESDLTINGTPGRPAGQDEQLGAFTVDAKRVDWIFLASEIDFGAGAVEPAEGDTIEFTFDGITRVYAVARDDSETVFRYCDELRLDIRVHTIHEGVA